MIKDDNGVTEMTAKTEMVYGRILSLGGKGGTNSYKIRLFLVKRSGADPCKLIRPSRYPPRHYGLSRNIFTRDGSCKSTNP